MIFTSHLLLPGLNSEYMNHSDDHPKINKLLPFDLNPRIEAFASLYCFITFAISTLLSSFDYCFESETFAVRWRSLTVITQSIWNFKFPSQPRIILEYNFIALRILCRVVWVFMLRIYSSFFSITSMLAHLPFVPSLLLNTEASNLP